MERNEPGDEKNPNKLPKKTHKSMDARFVRLFVASIQINLHRLNP